MMKSINGQHMLPESLADAEKLALDNVQRYRRCLTCGIPLHVSAAASTPASWRETQISGLCEPCFDDITDTTEGGTTDE